jgi:transposase-like protein
MATVIAPCKVKFPLREVHMAKVRRKRHQYTEEQRAAILDAARKERLTALQVQRKFGVTPVTYYSWRKKTGIAARRGGLLAAAGRGSDLTGHVRAEVQHKVRQMLPGIVRHEVSAYLDQVFSSSRRARRLRT